MSKDSLKKRIERLERKNGGGDGSDGNGRDSFASVIALVQMDAEGGNAESEHALGNYVVAQDKLKALATSYGLRPRDFAALVCQIGERNDNDGVQALMSLANAITQLREREMQIKARG